MVSLVNLAVNTGRILLFPQDSQFNRKGARRESFSRAWDTAVRTLFAVYYIPFVLVCFTGLIDSLVHVTVSALLPAVQAEAPEIGSMSAMAATQHWSSFGLLVLPYATAMAGVLAFAHNILKCLGESMVDSYSVFNDVNYSLTLGLFTFLLESRARVTILSIVSIAIIVGLAIVFLTDAIAVFSHREGAVVLATWSIIISQLVASALSVAHLALSADPLADYPQPGACGRVPAESLPRFRAFVIVWWRQNIGRVRHSAIKILGGFLVVWSVLYGPIAALSYAVETLIYLNVPNIIGFTCLETSVSVVRGIHSFRWWRRRSQHNATIWLLSAPYMAAWLYTFAFFQCSAGVTVMTIFAMWKVGVHVTDLCRQFEVSARGCVRWEFADEQSERSGSILSEGLAAELEDAFQRGQTTPALVSLEMRASLTSMTIESRVDGSVRPLRRVQLRPLGTPIPLAALVKSVLPRVILLQSRTSFAGSRFNRTRIVLKIITAVMMSILATVIGGALVQEIALPLQPVEVSVERRTSWAGADELVVRHLVVDLTVEFNTSLGHKNSTTGSLHGNLEDDELGHFCVRNHLDVPLFEMALLSVAPYLPHREAVNMFVDGVNGALDADWHVTFPTSGDLGPSRQPRGSWQSFVELRSARRNVSMVVIRGTDLMSLFDMLEDVSIYAESFLYQLMTHVIPAAHLVPSSLVTDSIELAAALEAYTVPWVNRRAPISAPRHFHEIVEHHVLHSYPSTQQRNRLVFVGHSLGGAIGHIVAARLGARSFGFQSPGIMLPRKKFGLTKEMLHRTTTTVFATGDIVPYIGGQAGELLQFECSDSVRERCHAAESVVASMWTRCASMRARYPRVLRMHIQ